RESACFQYPGGVIAHTALHRAPRAAERRAYRRDTGRYRRRCRQYRAAEKAGGNLRAPAGGRRNRPPPWAMCVRQWGGSCADGNFGARFSRNAANPSLTSGPRKQSISCASELSNTGPAIRIQLFRDFFVARIAVWLPCASFAAMASDLGSTSARGAQNVTRPMRSASLPSTKSAVIKSEERRV